MVCRNCKRELPVQAQYCPNCGRQVHKPHIHHGIETHGAEEETRARHIAKLLEPAYHEIEMRLEDEHVDKNELYDIVRRIEAEVVKGEAAHAEKVARWLRSLFELAPDVLAPTATALMNPEGDVSATVRATVQNFVPASATAN